MKLREYLNEGSYDWKDFEDALKKHDWSYEYSDDPRYYRRGRDSYRKIQDMIRRLKKENEKKVKTLYNRYAPKDWKMK